MDKILVLASTYPRWKGDTEPAFIEYLCSELAKNFEVHVLCPHYPGAAREERNGNIQVYRYRYFFDPGETLAYEGGILSGLRSNRHRYLLIPFFLLFQIIALVRLDAKHRFDIVHAHWIIPQGLIAVFARKIFRGRYRILLTAHGGDLYGLKSALFRSLKKKIIQACDHLSVVSNAMKQDCIAMGIGAEHISVCSMGVDLENLFVSRKPYEQRSDLVYVGRLVEKKGVVYLVRAISVLKKAGRQVHLRIIGDGPERDMLETLAGELDINDCIEFMGSVPNKEIPGYLNNARIFIMPSVVSVDGDQEGLGLVAVEAMGCGCVVIASDLPPVRDVIENGVTGVLVTPGSGQKIADAITALLDDPEKAGVLAIKGREYVAGRFDWKQVGKNYSGLLTGLINSV